MSLYAVKNDEGKWLGCEIYCDEPDWFDNGGFIWDTRSIAEENVKLYGGHVAELFEAPAKVAVSESEAEMLKRAKSREEYPAEIIHRYVYDSHNFSEWDYDHEIRLMRAYVNDYIVANEKKYLVYLDGLVTTDGAKQYLTKKDGKWFASRIMPGLHQEFTDEELNAAPKLAQKLDRVEVTDDEV